VVMGTARDQPDDKLLQYAVEVLAELERRGLTTEAERLTVQRLEQTAASREGKSQ
jgi:hypothetical protein